MRLGKKIREWDVASDDDVILVPQPAQAPEPAPEPQKTVGVPN